MMDAYGGKALSTPVLNESALKLRVGLARKRLFSYPLDTLNFGMLDLEQPPLMTRQAHQCDGDWTGRTLEFLSEAERICPPGESEARVHELFERVLRMKRADGRFGVCVGPLADNKLPMGLLSYYLAFGDMRALEGALGIGEYWLANADDIIASFNPDEPNTISRWLTEPLAIMYRLTGDRRYYDFFARVAASIGRFEGAHSHGFLTTMRGLSRMAIYSGEREWFDMSESFRRRIIDEKIVTATGDISESFPASRRNEGCSIADWVMLNLWAGYIAGDDSAYAQAEHSLYNALFFNQIVTGGFGHRSLTPYGYGADEYQEAWWCCTQTGGLAMCELARHAVTRDGDDIRINFLVPGDYIVPMAGCDVRVRIATRWPDRAEAVITAECLPGNARLRLRVPETVKNPSVAERRQGESATLTFKGDIGYTIDEWNDGKSVLKYGPQILAPSNYKPGKRPRPASADPSTIPDGYLNEELPDKRMKIARPERDGNGFYAFSHYPLAGWSYFEEGPASRTGSGMLTINVDIEYESGARRTLRFWPLSYNINTLTFYNTPICFE